VLALGATILMVSAALVLLAEWVRRLGASGASSASGVGA